MPRSGRFKRGLAGRCRRIWMTAGREPSPYSMCVRRWNSGGHAPAMLASRLKPASSASNRLMKNSPSRFDNLCLFYLGEYEGTPVARFT